MLWRFIAVTAALVLGGTVPARAAADMGASASSVPSSCSPLQPDVSEYLARVSAATLEPPAETGAIVCDFRFIDGAPMTVLHLIAGVPLRELVEARAYAAVNGYETGTVPNLGKGAFSKARDHKPRGLVALSGSDVYYAIMGQFSFAKDIALTRALFQLKFSASEQ